jgi:hypothetical protein
MAGPFTGLLDGLGSGFLRPKGQMGDWQHAARTFVDDNYRLAPKAKFLYHVYFAINKSALVHKKLSERHSTELGLLVKSVDLPKFSIKTATVNQYNRKKVVQTSHNFGPITLRFHDDRNHIVNQLWQSYYMYYYGDPSTGNIAGAYKRNAMNSWNTVKGSYGYDNNSGIPFFDYIMLYQLNKREYVSYKIINPLIQSFNHDTPNSSDQGSTGAECSMTIAYEAVTYDVGTIRAGTVKGFASDHYDKSPSPLSAAGGGTRSLFGVGGVIEGAADVIGSISNGTAFSSLENIVNTASTIANTAQNVKGLTKAGIKQEGVGLLTGGALLVAGSAINGLKGTFFPSSNSTSGPTALRREDLGGT